MSTMFAVAVPAAFVGAVSIGLATAAQAYATKQVQTATSLDPRLVTRLVRQPLWLFGIGATIVGLVLQMVALNFGPLVLVQPILITSLLFASLFSAWLDKRKADGVLMIGAALCCGGLAAFLTLANPSAGLAIPAASAQLLPLTVLLMVVLAIGVLVARRVRHSVKVLLLALATGLAYGLTAALMKVITAQLDIGIGYLFGHPVLYVTCLLGPMGFLLAQYTFQEGRLVSPALAVITTVDPVVGVLLGMVWFDERVSISPLIMLGELLAGAAVVGGIVLLARRANHLMPTGTRSLEGTTDQGIAPAD